MRNITALTVLLVALSGSCLVSCMDVRTATNIRAQIRQMITDDNDMALIGGLVRLSFHDCVGGCDGCINGANPDNAGLQVYIDRADLLFETLTVDEQLVDMSRADFWALAGIEAATLAAEKARGPDPNIIMYTGRVDCETSPTTDEMVFLPDALGDNEHVMKFFNDEFGFDVKEATAILGAHTLGKAHSDASGFKHPWVPRKKALDNDFYSHLRDPAKGWAQVSTGKNDDQKFFWETPGSSKQLMLNADMSLIRNLSSKDDKGQVSCTFSSCPVVNSDSVDWVDAFAENNTLWVEEFSKAFQKMIENEWEGQLAPLVEITTTSTTSTTSMTSPPQEITSICSNNHIPNGAMESKSGYKKASGRRLSIKDQIGSTFPGTKMFHLRCRQRTPGFYQIKGFGRRLRVKSFVASLWSRLRKPKRGMAKSDSYSLRVDIMLYNGNMYTRFDQFEPNTDEWHRSVIEYSTEEDNIRFVKVWAVCGVNRIIAYFDEMGLLVNPTTCVLPV